MNYPKYFDSIETIKLHDKLSKFLGATEDGIVEFSYFDSVKSAGHSCPTVAGAYLTTLKGLKALYGEEMPQRGEIEVSFKDDSKDGVVGVISMVITHITGATETMGFKGIAGKFARNGLMSFNNDIPSTIMFQRLDTQKSVYVRYDPSMIPVDPMQTMLMKKCISGSATSEEETTFGKLWQKRVENIFAHAEDVISIQS